jgi:CheY-like chemotaxis protein/signal transduction histidine kinase
MQSIISLTDRTPILRADLAAGDAAQAIADRPDVRVAAVSGQDGAVVGLIERSAVERAIRDGQASRAIGDLMLDAPLVVDARYTVDAAFDLLMAHPGRPEALVVTDGGAYVGVCTLRALAQDLSAKATLNDQAVAEECERLFGAAEIEFRGHVQGLLAMTDRLARQHLGADALIHVHSIQAASETLLRLADDARDMLHARQGRLKLDPRPQPLRALMDEVQARWTDRAREAGVALLISYDGDPDLSVVIDSDRLAQVFDNLIDNALRYTRQGSIEASLRARIAGERVTLDGSVRDTGPDANSVRVSAGPDGEGPSLQLSLNRSILASMGGALRAESNAGPGATLLFNLSAPLPGEPAAAVSAMRQTPSSNGTPHILVVDDNATNRMVAEALCEMFDCTSETAEDGLEAVERMLQGRFDVILMDIKMPRMDGIAATRAIRALPGPAALTPIVALTANVDAEDARGYLAAGMCCVVEKPIKPDRLLHAINIALESATAAAMPADPGRVVAA